MENRRKERERDRERKRQRREKELQARIYDLLSEAIDSTWERQHQRLWIALRGKENQ